MKVDEIIKHLKDKAPIVKAFRGFIILAQNKHDYIIKKHKILHGKTQGFYKIDEYEDRYIKNRS